MDWLPTLLAAAGTRPDPRYPSDGMSYLKLLTGEAPPKPRKLFWRYNSLGQQAVREGDFKYLKILDNTFLFNIVEDPLERANLKDRYPHVFERLAKDWQAWNKTLLPYTDRNISWTGSGRMLADHFGAPGGIVPTPPPSIDD
jgi:arylsulfatase A-like enzyme